MAGRETLPASGHSTTRNPEVDERSARQKRVRSVASAHEAKIHLGQHTPFDSCFRLRNLEWEHRRSIGRTFDRFESPNFGWNIVLNLKIDGRTVANIVQGRRYEHFVPAGRHVLTASAVPNTYYSEPTSTVLNVRSGRTYVFTALWDGSNRVVLATSALPPGQAY
jgi:hypothetical protein